MPCVRQYAQPVGGKITIDGIDIAEIDATFYRRNMLAFCDQVPEFIPGTVRDNLRLLNTAVTDGEILEIFREIGAADFAERFDNFLDLKIEERDIFNIATKNLLNIVRTLLKTAPIYVFNQCFEHVNPDYVARVFEKIRREGKTCLFITQNTAVSKHCDRVYVLKKGAVSSVGVHSELIAGCRDYCELCLSSGGRIFSAESVV